MKKSDSATNNSNPPGKFDLAFTLHNPISSKNKTTSTMISDRIKRAQIKHIRSGNVTLRGVMCDVFDEKAIKDLCRQRDEHQARGGVISNTRLKVSASKFKQLRQVIRPFFDRYSQDLYGGEEEQKVLTKDDFSNVLKELGESTDSVSAERILFEAVDTDNSGAIDFDEFSILMLCYLMEELAVRRTGGVKRNRKIDEKERRRLRKEWWSQQTHGEEAEIQKNLYINGGQEIIPSSAQMSVNMGFDSVVGRNLVMMGGVREVKNAQRYGNTNPNMSNPKFNNQYNAQDYYNSEGGFAGYEFDSGYEMDSRAFDDLNSGEIEYEEMTLESQQQQQMIPNLGSYEEQEDYQEEGEEEDDNEENRPSAAMARADMGQDDYEDDGGASPTMGVPVPPRSSSRSSRKSKSRKSSRGESRKSLKSRATNKSGKSLKSKKDGRPGGSRAPSGMGGSMGSNDDDDDDDYSAGPGPKPAKDSMIMLRNTNTNTTGGGNTTNTNMMAENLTSEAKSDEEEDEEEEDEMPEDIARAPPDQQKSMIITRSCWMMGAGVLLCLLFSDPAVEVMVELGNRSGMGEFWVAFLLAPLASNTTELLNCYKYGCKKTRASVSVCIGTLQACVILNNTIVMFVTLLCGAISLKDPWDYLSNTIAIFVTSWITFVIGCKKTNNLLDAFICLSLMPLNFVIMYVFPKYLGMTGQDGQGH